VTELSLKKDSETQKKESEKLHKEYWKAWEKQKKESQREIRKLLKELHKLWKKQKE